MPEAKTQRNNQPSVFQGEQMTRWEIANMCNESEVVDNIEFIQSVCKDKDVLDIGCIRHNAIFSTQDPNWLHGKIHSVAKSVIGCDYLTEEVEKFSDTNYDIRCYDITKPVDLEKKFDVIVAGYLIEHLSNFDGFYENCKRLLKPDGVLLISTANPFFKDVFHFNAFKGLPPLNPEHTCWICPHALSQLSARFGFEIVEIHYTTPSWNIGAMILESESFQYDIINDTWSDYTFFTKALRFGVERIFNLLYIPYTYLTLTNTKTTRHAHYIAVLKIKK